MAVEKMLCRYCGKQYPLKAYCQHLENCEAKHKAKPLEEAQKEKVDER